MQSNDDAPKRILVVEDSPIVSLDTDEMLRAHGYHVVGPAPTMAIALELAQKEHIDAAVVDVNIRGGKAYPALRILAQRGVPFLLTSGYADWSMPPEWQDRPRLQKPYSAELLASRVAEIMSSADQPAGDEGGENPAEGASPPPESGS